MKAVTLEPLLARSRTRWLSLSVGIGVLATFPLRVAIGNSEEWRAFAGWIVG